MESPTVEPYAVLATTDVVIATGDVEPVFFTNGCGSDFVASGLLVRTGRDRELELVREGADFWGSTTGEVAGGWLIGRLEIVFVTSGRSWAKMFPPDPAATTNAAAARNAIFFNIIYF